jgi:hypothetical protein
VGAWPALSLLHSAFDRFVRPRFYYGCFPWAGRHFRRSYRCWKIGRWFVTWGSCIGKRAMLEQQVDARGVTTALSDLRSSSRLACSAGTVGSFQRACAISTTASPLTSTSTGYAPASARWRLPWRPGHPRLHRRVPVLVLPLTGRNRRPEGTSAVSATMLGRFCRSHDICHKPVPNAPREASALVSRRNDPRPVDIRWAIGEPAHARQSRTLGPVLGPPAPSPSMTWRRP